MIQDLSTHPNHHLSVVELATYWAVSRQQIYRLIESGALEAIRFGSRLYRIPTRAALEFEQRTNVPGMASRSADGRVTPATQCGSDKFPTKIGLQRVPFDKH